MEAQQRFDLKQKTSAKEEIFQDEEEEEAWRSPVLQLAARGRQRSRLFMHTSFDVSQVAPYSSDQLILVLIQRRCTKRLWSREMLPRARIPPPTCPQGVREREQQRE